MSKRIQSGTLPEFIGLGTLANLAGVQEQWIRKLANSGAIPEGVKGSGVWPCEESIKKLFAYYRELSADNAEEMAREKLRKMTADADTSQMAAARESGEIMLAADSEALWGDRIVTLRQHVERCGYIPAEDRKRLLNELAELKFESEG